MGKCYVCGKSIYATKVAKRNLPIKATKVRTAHPDKGLKHLDRDICKKCFLRNTERRVKRHLRNGAQQVAHVGPPHYRGSKLKRVPPRQRLFKRNDKILVVGEVERVLLERAIKGMPLKITSRKRLPKEVKGFNWVVIGKTMDEVIEEFLERLFKGKLVLEKMKKRFFNILEVLTDEEVKQYARLKGIKFVVKEKKRVLDKLKEFKEIKYNLYKNVRKLREVN